MAELSDRVAKLEADNQKLMAKVFRGEILDEMKAEIDDRAKAETEKITDEVKAINANQNLDAKQKKEAILALEGLSKKRMEELMDKFNKEAKEKFGGSF